MKQNNQKSNKQQYRHILYYDRQVGTIWKQLPAQLYQSCSCPIINTLQMGKLIADDIGRNSNNYGHQRYQHNQQLLQIYRNEQHLYQTRPMSEDAISQIIQYIRRHQPNSQISILNTTIIQLYDVHVCNNNNNNFTRQNNKKSLNTIITRTTIKPTVNNTLQLNQLILMDISKQPASLNKAQHRRSLQLYHILGHAMLMFVAGLTMTHNSNPNIVKLISKQYRHVHDNHNDTEYHSNSTNTNVSISISMSKLPSILHLPFLQHLDLSHNNIQSIECLLTLIHTPQLTKLQLSNNNITSIRNLHRIIAFCPKLQQLYLFNNKIVDVSDGNNCNIVASAISKFGFKELKIELFTTSSVNFGQGLQWIVKCGIGANQQYQQQSMSDYETNAIKLTNFQPNNSYKKVSSLSHQFKQLNIESKSRIGVHTHTIKQILHKKYTKIKIKANIVLPRVVPIDRFNF